MIFERVGVDVKITKKNTMWVDLKFSLVQILVVVAIIQARNLKVEAEKGFKRTLLELEWVDSNIKTNIDNNVQRFLNNFGKRVNISVLVNLKKEFKNPLKLHS